MSVFVAHNIGAKKALFYVISTSLFIGLFLSHLSYFHGDILAELFANVKL